MLTTFLLLATLNQTPRIACLGDSITSGGYCDTIGKLLKTETKTFGYPGRKIFQIEQEGLQAVLEWHPTTVVVLAGTNNLLSGDGAASTIKQLSRLHESLKSKGLRVIAVTIPPCRGWLTVKNPYVAGGLPYGEIHYPQVRLVNEWILRNHGVDLSSLGDSNGFLLGKYSTGDGLHPNALGQKLLGTEIVGQVLGR